jgi:DNA invertase Pin-like site-specific DNA recombinase
MTTTTAAALAYTRTSSASNVGADKDSEKRQREAIEGFAALAGCTVAERDWFYDPAVRGADALDVRPGFSRLLDRIEANGVRVVIVEDASRFARDLMTQELGIMLLIKRGVRLLTAGGDDLTASDDPTRKMMRQIAGAFAEYEKARLVLKLRGARQRKKAATGKCEGRKALAETNPELATRAKELRATGLALRAIADQLAADGYLNENGRPYNHKTVRSLVR